MSEQYLTSSQFLAQALRQVISRPHTTQVLLGRLDLLPLNEVCLAILMTALIVQGSSGYEVNSHLRHGKAKWRRNANTRAISRTIKACDCGRINLATVI